MRALVLFSSLLCAVQCGDIMIKVIQEAHIGNCGYGCSQCNGESDATTVDVGELQQQMDQLEAQVAAAQESQAAVASADSTVDDLASAVSARKRRHRRQSPANTVSFTSCEDASQTISGTIEDVILQILDAIKAILDAVSGGTVDSTKLNCYIDLANNLTDGLTNNIYTKPNATNIMLKINSVKSSVSAANSSIATAIDSLEQQIEDTQNAIASAGGDGSSSDKNTTAVSVDSTIDDNQNISVAPDDPSNGWPTGDWSRSCRKEFYLHYLAKECTPMGVGPCPSYFSCPKKIRDSSKCYYRGKEYDLQESVPVDDPCAPGCFCSEPFQTGDLPEITCGVFDCPMLPDPVGPNNCIPLYSHDQCCPAETTCSTEGTETITCEVNNKTYVKGQYISYDEYPCQSCICQEEHDGPQGPGCRPIDCGLDFRYTRELDQGCVSLYLEKRCCPIEWICPDDPPTEEEEDDNKCYFGDRIFSLGERLEREKCEEVCGCHTPPDLTCVKYKDCQEAQNSTFYPRI